MAGDVKKIQNSSLGLPRKRLNKKDIFIEYLYDQQDYLKIKYFEPICSHEGGRVYEVYW